MAPTSKWSLSGEGLVKIDRQRIEQAVLILVDNAAKYGRPGGTVTLTSYVRSGELRISVADGVPVSPGKSYPTSSNASTASKDAYA